MKLKYRILIPLVSALLILFVSYSLVIFFASMDRVLGEAQKVVRLKDETSGARLSQEFCTAFKTAETLASQFSEMSKSGTLSRRAMNRYLINALKTSDVESIWCVWPQIDGRDRHHVNNLGHYETGVYNPWYAFSEGKLVVDDCGSYRTNSYFRTPFDENRNHLYEPYETTIGGKSELMVGAAVPIRRNGEPVGVMGVDFLASGLGGLVSRELQNVDRNDGVMLLAPDLTIAAHEETLFIGANLSELAVVDRLAEASIPSAVFSRFLGENGVVADSKALKQWARGGFREYLDANEFSGVDQISRSAVRLVASLTFRPSEWQPKFNSLKKHADLILGVAGGEELPAEALCSRVSDSLISWTPINLGDDRQAWFLASVNNLTPLIRQNVAQILGMIGFGLAFTVLIFFLISFLISRITRPIHHAQEVIQQLAEGESDLTRELEPHRSAGEELNGLITYLNRFIVSLRDIIISIRETLQAADLVKDKLIVSSGEAGRSVSTIERTIQVSDSLIRETTNGLRGADDQIKSINADIHGFRKNIDEQTTAIEESSAAVNEMVASIQNLYEISSKRAETSRTLREATGEGREKLEKTTTHITTIAGRAENMLQAIKVVNNIAGQTNLLAMNAAIEAAHAGDAGRGFAVVADEIRKLAEDSARNANVISSSLKETVDEIQQVAGVSALTMEAFQSIANESDQQIAAFQEIADSLTELSVGGRQVLSAVHEMKDQSIQVNKEAVEVGEGVSVIQGLVTEAVNGIEGANSMVLKIKKQSRALETVVKDFDILSSNIKNRVEAATDRIGRFKTGR